MKSCTCAICRACCCRKPGWFEPAQVKSVLKYFKAKGIEAILGKNMFAIDWFVAEKDILVLAPNIVGNSGIQYPRNPTGQCVFFKEERCQIYEIRPKECAVAMHDDSTVDVHKEIAMLWKESSCLNNLLDIIHTETGSIFDLFW